MKVVIFCGGLGMRLREYSESIPKPMVPVGYRPILWHLMRYYAHFGHNEFILCLGYKGDTIKKYFLDYDETVSNDFVMSEGGRKVDLLASDIQDWKITFVDTGMSSNIGMRLKAVEPYVAGDEMFLANYSDGLSDLPLPDAIQYFERRPEMVACFAGVAPTSSFHLVTLEDGGRVKAIRHVRDTGMRINGGFFVLSPKVIDLIDRSGLAYRVTAMATIIEGRPPRLENKAVLVDPSGCSVYSYIKKNPVPGWEARISTKSDGRMPVRDSEYGRLSSAICFDMDFPHFLRQVGKLGADILLVPASDWEAIKDLHHQMAEFRAIENGVSLVRATRWGISTAVDAFGRTSAATDSFSASQDVMVAQVPLRGIPTLYAKLGDWFVWLCLAGLAGMTAWSLLGIG